MIRERESHGFPDCPSSSLSLLALAGLAWALRGGDCRPTTPSAPRWSAIGFAMCCLLLAGLFMVNPNEGKVLQLFGGYVGTAQDAGPALGESVLTKRSVSLRVRNFESSHLKVNDIDGNPIEIAAVVVWRVVETAEAVFEVDDYENYVQGAERGGGAQPRDAATPTTRTTTTGRRCAATPAAVAEHLKREIQERLAKAGVEVIEARISHLAYAPEIAAAMLQRQQAGAIIAARQRIVEGAVGMVEMALDMLSQKAIVAARRGAQGGDGQQPAGRAVRRARHAAGHQHRHDLPVSGAVAMAERKPFLLRIDPALLEAVQRWANDDLRSLNAQIEFLLRRALQEAGRARNDASPPAQDPDADKLNRPARRSRRSPRGSGHPTRGGEPIRRTCVYRSDRMAVDFRLLFALRCALRNRKPAPPRLTQGFAP